MAFNSAALQAQRSRELGFTLARLSRAAHAEAGRFAAASAGEHLVASTLTSLTAIGWRLLVDRHWPGTVSANVDMLLVGPPGVFVVDVKSWRAAPEVVDDRLRCDGEDRDREIGKLMAVTRIAEDTVAGADILGTAVLPLMVFAGRRVDGWCRQVRLGGSDNLVAMLAAMPSRLPPAQVRRAADRLERRFPAYQAVAFDLKAAEAALASTAPVAEPLIDIDEVTDGYLRAALAQPIESWMTFLHPDQAKLVRREWNGPARISGAAGTGKTVVGLHRAIHLAKQHLGRVLYVTHATNLPRVEAKLIERMAPAIAPRVQCVNLHAWARQLLHERGVPVRPTDFFGMVWMRHGRGGVLERLEPSPTYWQEEIDHVIKGRDVTTFDQYAALTRFGRRTPLGVEHRRAVWDLFLAYEEYRRERGRHDFNDLIALALAEVRREPVTPAYAAVIADEVQDLNLLGVRLLHALVGDAPNGLLLIGDCRQAVYPGGFRLSEAGITIRGGRAEVLHVNYRNGADILNTAAAVLDGDTFDDIDGTTDSGRPDVDLDYRDGTVRAVTAATPAEHDAALLDAIRDLSAPADGSRLGDAAVLCARPGDVVTYRGLLTRAGFPVQPLDEYDGTPNASVKIGTFRRAKGLEFKYVFLPHHRRSQYLTDGRAIGDPDRRVIANRQLFVAMTRARDLLWLGDCAAGDTP